MHPSLSVHILCAMCFCHFSYADCRSHCVDVKHIVTHSELTVQIYRVEQRRHVKIEFINFLTRVNHRRYVENQKRIDTNSTDGFWPPIQESLCWHYTGLVLCLRLKRGWQSKHVKSIPMSYSSLLQICSKSTYGSSTLHHVIHQGLEHMVCHYKQGL